MDCSSLRNLIYASRDCVQHQRRIIAIGSNYLESPYAPICERGSHLCTVFSTLVVRRASSKGQQPNEERPHAPYLVTIRYPLTNTTNPSDTGKNTFHPSRISWS